MRNGRCCAAAAAVAVVLISGCGQAGGGERQVPVAPDRCDEVVFPALQSGSHLLGDTDPPVPYSSSPPTSGWHSSGAVPEGIFAEPLSEPQQVSVLEAGGVVVTHNGLATDELQALTDAVERQYLDRVVVTPYDAIPEGSTAFTSWGAVQVCTGVDLDALDAYAAAYASEISPHD